jgi:uncharacterized protein YggE
MMLKTILLRKLYRIRALNKKTLTTSSNANISSFIDFAVNSGANRVDGIEFTTSKKVPNENYKELLKEAFNDPKQKAEILSNEGKFYINSAKNIDLSQNNGINRLHPIMHLSKIDRHLLLTKQVPANTNNISRKQIIYFLACNFLC